MRISAISDVHVKAPNDLGAELLLKFLKHPLVQESQYIVLLGDIFDLMCGPHEEYISKYSHLFERMNELIDNGANLYYFEGNHDLHLEKLFLKIRPDGKLRINQHPIVLNVEGKSYYFSHGDEHEVDNMSYQRYKKFIMTAPLKFFANYIMPYKLLNYIGERASKTSREKGAREFNSAEVMNRFRSGVEISTLGKFDFILGGHSHVRDIYKMQNGKSMYINNGYAIASNSFITIKDHDVSFVDF